MEISFGDPWDRELTKASLLQGCFSSTISEMIFHSSLVQKETNFGLMVVNHSNFFHDSNSKRW